MTMRARPKITFVVFVVLVAAIVALTVFVFAFQQDRINRLNDRIIAQSAQYDLLFDSYRDLTTDCAAADDCVTNAPRPSQLPQSLETSTPGEQGERGDRGLPGRDGRTPTAAEVLDVVRLFCAANDGCRGPQGIPGMTGANGETIVGPTGPAGPAGSDGAPGAPGTPGAPGAAGAPGSPGAPPLSWTYTDMLGLTHTCTRTEPFDPASPTYSCT